MLHCKGQVFLREVEHIEDDGLGATILTMMNGANHLDDSLTLMNNLRLAILADDCQFSLNQNTIVHGHMVVPS